MAKHIFENDFLSVYSTEEGITLAFSIDDEKPYEIGEKMRSICKDAYMNGYNWDAFLNYYFQKNSPELLVGMETDCEASGYFAYYEDSAENESKAVIAAKCIESLIQNPETVFDFLKDNSDKIQWD